MARYIRARRGERVRRKGRNEARGVAIAQPFSLSLTMAAMRSDQRHMMRSFVPSRRGFWNNDTTRDGANGGERVQVPMAEQ